jgi:phage gp45-like
MNWDKNSLRNFILLHVKPLKAGKHVTQKGEKATLDHLFPEGSDDDFRLTSPFGFISKIPKGIIVFYDALFGSSYENITQGHIHAERPEPIGVGETVLYSTDDTGKTIKVKISLMNDGTLNIESNKDININCTNKLNITSASDVTASCSGNLVVHSQGDSTISCNAKTTISSTGEIDITSANKVVVKCDDVELGEGGVEKILNGETFQTFFNSHTHLGNIGFPTSAPIAPSNPSHLSNVVKAKK